jgi:hypothetical protein
VSAVPGPAAARDEAVHLAETAVDPDRLPGDPRGGGVEQPGDRCGDVLGLPEPAEHVHLAAGGRLRLVVDHALRHAGAGEARRDRVHAYAARPVGRRCGTHERDDAALGRGDRLVVRDPGLRGGGRREHDRAAVLTHPRRGGTDDREGRGQVRGDDVVPLIGRRQVGRLEQQRPSEVGDAVEPPVLLGDAVDQRTDLGDVAGVDRVDRGAAEKAAERVRRLTVTAGERHTVAALDEHPRGRAADPTCRADD